MFGFRLRRLMNVRMLAGLVCLALAVVPPVLMACSAGNSGFGNTCSVNLYTECGTACYPPGDCGLSYYHSSLNPFFAFYGCKAASQPWVMCILEGGGGCIQNLFVSSDCTWWAGYATPNCFCECRRAY